MTETQFTGEDLPAGVYIQRSTNPWLRNPAGEDVKLDGPEIDMNYDGCYACAPGILAGVFAPVDSAIGIQACDNCGVFEGDLEAAQALAEHLGGGLTVWFLAMKEEVL